MDLLALIGFPKAIEYEFKAVKGFATKFYFLYVKRPGKRTWNKCMEYNFSRHSFEHAFLSYNNAVTTLNAWAADPQKFEEEQPKGLKAPRVILVKENISARKMHRALE